MDADKPGRRRTPSETTDAPSPYTIRTLVPEATGPEQSSYPTGRTVYGTKRIDNGLYGRVRNTTHGDIAPPQRVDNVDTGQVPGILLV